MALVGVTVNDELKDEITEYRIRIRKQIKRLPTESELGKALILEGLKSNEETIIKRLKNELK